RGGAVTAYDIARAEDDGIRAGRLAGIVELEPVCGLALAAEQALLAEGALAVLPDAARRLEALVEDPRLSRPGGKAPTADEAFALAGVAGDVRGSGLRRDVQDGRGGRAVRRGRDRDAEGKAAVAAVAGIGRHGEARGHPSRGHDDHRSRGREPG